MKKRILTFLLFFTLIFSANTVQASHIMGGDITYTCNGGNNYDIQLRLYRDCYGIALGASQNISLTSPTCGSQTMTLTTTGAVSVTPICPTAIDACSGQPGSIIGVEEVVYTGNITLSPTGCSDWTISWSTCCRNSAITNLSSPNSHAMYIESKLDDATAVCNSSPEFHNRPIFYGCVNQPVTYSHGVSDADNDSLVFSLVNCYTAVGVSVNYNAGFSATTPFTTNTGIAIDPNTGVVTFTPSAVQTGVIGVLVEEYRNGVKIGEVMRDIQMGILNCSNNTPTLSGMNGSVGPGSSTGSKALNTCVGAPICFTVDSYDPDSATQNLTLTLLNTLPGATFTVGTGSMPTATICWTPTSADIGANLFSVHVKDDNCPIIGENVRTYIVNVSAGGNGNPVGIATPDTTIFIGDSLQLATYGVDSSCTVTWTPSVGLSCTTCPNPIATPTVGTTYTATIDCGGCIITDTVFVDAITPFNIIQGIVSSNTSGALANTPVALMDSNYVILGVQITNAQGFYSYSTYTPKGYLQVVPTPFPNEMTTYVPNAIVIQDAMLLDFTGTNTFDLTTYSRVDLQGTGSLGGILKDNAGSILPNIRVVLLDEQNTPIDDVTTTSTGYVHFDNLIEGTYTLWVDQLGIDNSLAPSVVLDAAFPNKDSLGITLLSDRLEITDLTNTRQFDAFSYYNIYPNPASDVVYLKYGLKKAQFVSVDIYNLTGQKIITIVKGKQSANDYLIDLQPYIKGESGVYLISIRTEGGLVTKQLIYR